MTVNVPTENAERVGLRKVIDEEMVERVLKVLHGNGTKMPKNWNRRFKYNRDKMKTGDIFELAEVVRNLSLRDQEKGLSTGEKQMFVKAKKILASELMYAKGMDEDEAAAWLDEELDSVSATGRRASCARSRHGRRHPFRVLLRAADPLRPRGVALRRAAPAANPTASPTAIDGSRLLASRRSSVAELSARRAGGRAAAPT